MKKQVQISTIPCVKNQITSRDHTNIQYIKNFLSKSASLKRKRRQNKQTDKDTQKSSKIKSVKRKKKKKKEKRKGNTINNINKKKLKAWFGSMVL